MAEFSGGATASVKMKVNTTTGGYIAQETDTVKGTKNPTIAGIKATANLAEATAVLDAFYGGIGGGSFDSLSAVKTMHQEVVE